LAADAVTNPSDGVRVVDELLEHRAQHVLGSDRPPDVDPGVGGLAQKCGVT